MSDLIDIQGLLTPDTLKMDESVIQQIQAPRQNLADSIVLPAGSKVDRAELVPASEAQIAEFSPRREPNYTCRAWTEPQGAQTKAYYKDGQLRLVRVQHYSTSIFSRIGTFRGGWQMVESSLNEVMKIQGIGNAANICAPPAAASRYALTGGRYKEVNRILGVNDNPQDGTSWIWWLIVRFTLTTSDMTITELLKAAHRVCEPFR